MLMISLAFKTTGQILLDGQMMREVISMDSISEYNLSDPYLIVLIVSKNNIKTHYITPLSSLRAALRIEAGISHSPYPSMHDQIINGYENGYLLTKKKSLKFLAFKTSSEPDLQKVLDDESFKKSLTVYAEKLLLLKEYNEIKHNKGKLGEFLIDHEDFDATPSMLTSNIYEFIQLMWVNGLIVCQNHGRKFIVLDKERFIEQYSSLNK
jgi:hypothetical protein